jgi:hypothetical protein
MRDQGKETILGFVDATALIEAELAPCVTNDKAGSDKESNLCACQPSPK